MLMTNVKSGSDFKFVVFVLQRFDLLVECCYLQTSLFNLFIYLGYPLLVLLVQRFILLLKKFHILLELVSFRLQEFDFVFKLFNYLIFLVHLVIVLKPTIWCE